MVKEIKVTPLYHKYVLDNDYRVVVQVGGRFSGKSHNEQVRLSANLASKENYKLLVIEDLETGMADGFHAGLRDRIDDFEHTPAYNPRSRTAHVKNNINGNQALFRGYSSEQQRLNVKKLSGITEILVEEGEWMDYESFIGLLQQLRGGNEEDRKLTILMNPVNPRCFVNQLFIVTPPQKVYEYFQGTKRPKVFERHISTKFELDGEEVTQTIKVLVVISTHYDNPFLTLDQRASIEQLKETDPELYAQLGEAKFIMPSGTFFDMTKVQHQLNNLYPPLDVGEFEFEYKDHQIVDSTIKWVSDPNGCISIYSEPEEGIPYVLSGDTAGDGSDWNIGYMVNNTNQTDVAVLRLNYDEDLYARQMYCFGKWYGSLNKCFYDNHGDEYIDALIGIETNFSTHPQKELERLGYRNFYIREQSPDSFTSKMSKKFGFNTNRATRPDMLGKLRKFVREACYKLRSQELLLEMTTFIKNEKGRPEAADGYHDDMVMARAINLAIDWQQPTYKSVKKPKHKIHRALDSSIGKPVEANSIVDF